MLVGVIHGFGSFFHNISEAALVSVAGISNSVSRNLQLLASGPQTINYGNDYDNLSNNTDNTLAIRNDFRNDGNSRGRGLSGSGQVLTSVGQGILGTSSNILAFVSSTSKNLLYSTGLQVRKSYI